MTCEVHKQESLFAACTLGKTYNCAGGSVHVSGGCRGWFQCSGFKVRCGDWRGWSSSCACGPKRASPPGSCILLRRESLASCTFGKTFTCSARRIHVSEGCRGLFRCNGAEVRCGDRRGRERLCACPKLSGATAAKMHSNGASSGLRSAAPQLRVAVCLSGAPRALLHANMRAHLRAVLAPIAHDDRVHVDTFLHIDCGEFGGAVCKWLLRPAFHEFQAIGLTLYNSTGLNRRLAALTGIVDAHGVSRAMQRDLRDCPAAVSSCCTAGYAAATKWRGCLRNIEAAEMAADTPYDFVLRLRPDVEHAYALPPAAEWMHLRRDVAFTMLAFKAAGDCHPGDALPWLRIGGSPIPVSKPGTFVDDNLALLPRAAAHAYFSIADELEKCVPVYPKNALCGRRWEWAECRVSQALAQVEGLAIAEVRRTVTKSPQSIEPSPTHRN